MTVKIGSLLISLGLESGAFKSGLSDADKELKKAVALPRGFVTKVLLDYDFSDDEQVLSFLREYGPVMCPYAGAIDRTFAAIEDPLSYRRLLHSVVSERQAEDERRDGGAFARLFDDQVHGVGGIRTPDRGFHPYNGLANRRLQPLGHHSPGARI